MLEITTVVSHKKCSCCGQLKPTSEFFRSAKSKDGLQSYCKTCQRELSKKTRVKKAEAAAMASSTLQNYTPRQLIAELYRRGWRGELHEVRTVKLDDSWS